MKASVGRLTCTNQLTSHAHAKSLGLLGSTQANPLTSKTHRILYTILEKNQSPRIPLKLLGLGVGGCLLVHDDPRCGPESHKRTNKRLEVKEPRSCVPHSTWGLWRPPGLSAHNISWFVHLLIIKKEHECSAQHTRPSPDVLGSYDWRLSALQLATAWIWEKW